MFRKVNIHFTWVVVLKVVFCVEIKSEIRIRFLSFISANWEVETMSVSLFASSALGSIGKELSERGDTFLFIC